MKSADDEQRGWLRIESLDANAPGGWASGHRPSPDRLVIEAENVHQFSVDLSQLELDWGNRVWMKINRHTFELGHKRHPVVHFRETKAGAWEVIEVHDD